MGKSRQLCGASVIIYNGDYLLLQRRRDNGCWGYHGGRIEVGEVVEEAAKRELFEETGLSAGSLTLFGVFSGPNLHHVYPDGNEFDIIDIVFISDDFSGEPKMQESEVTDLRWFHYTQIPDNISPPIRGALLKFVSEHYKIHK